MKVLEGPGHGGGPRHALWLIPSPETIQEIFGVAIDPEPGADEHFRRHLAGEPPLAPYDGSFRRRAWWKKVSELEGYNELVDAWNDCVENGDLFEPLDMRH